MSEIFLEPADSQEQGWEIAAGYAQLLRAAGLTAVFGTGAEGKYTVGVRKVPGNALRGAGGRYQVMLFREDDDEQDTQAEQGLPSGEGNAVRDEHQLPAR
jgi:hypothetical protein